MKSNTWKSHIGINGNRRRIVAIQKRLERNYGPFVPKKRLDPVDELILTVLSQNTNDLNRDRAYSNLRKKFPTWEDVANAMAWSIEQEIRVGGLSANKSRAIKRILREIKTRHGAIDLSHLKKLPLQDAIDELTSLPMVGLKTASCVMLFSFGRPTMPVDTHVHRLSMRLGFVTEKSTADQTYGVLMSITPPEIIYPFHLNLIQHGKRVCKSQHPRCDECVVNDLCPSMALFI
jgi:endonuclease III